MEQAYLDLGKKILETEMSKGIAQGLEPKVFLVIKCDLTSLKDFHY